MSRIPHWLRPTTSTHSAILWGQVWGLATMLAAILFSFMV